MNASVLVTRLRSKNAYLWVDKDELVIRAIPRVMTPDVVADIRSHKSEIIDFLNAANDATPKRYAYRYEFKNNEGAGTWITNYPPQQAEQEVVQRFSHYELEVFTLIN